MPIKGLTDNPRIPRVAKIHLGIKKVAKSGAEYPSATDYFVIPPERQDVIDKLGAEPRSLPVMIAMDTDKDGNIDDDLWASTYYRAYSSSRGLVCKGDGETAFRTVPILKGGELGTAIATHNDEKVAKTDVICAGKDCPDFKRKACKEMMCLQFLMPDVAGLGIWQIDTSSTNSIQNIYGCATLLRRIYKTVALIPLELTLEPKEVINPDDGKKKNVRVMHLRSSLTPNEMAVIASGPKHLLIPASFEAPDDSEAPDPEPDDDVIEGVIVADEVEEPTEERKPGLPIPVKNLVVESSQSVVGAILEVEDTKPAPAAKATPVPKATKAPDKDPDGLPVGFPAKGGMGTATNAQVSVLRKHAEAANVTMEDMTGWMKAAAESRGVTAPDWTKVTQQQVRWLGVQVIKKIAQEDHDGDKGSGAKPETTQPAGSTERAEELAAAAADGDDWDSLVTEIDDNCGS